MNMNFHSPGVHRSAPYYVMSITAFLGFIGLFWLPETATRPMRDVAGDDSNGEEKNVLFVNS